MNKHQYRLVFNRHRGMRVAAAETARSAGKAASGQTRGGRLLAQLGVVGSSLAMAPGASWGAPPIPKAAAVTPGANLPVRSTDANRLKGDWGRFTVAVPQGNKLVVNQQSTRAIVNWDSFNVGAGQQVQFVQPDKGSTLNKIWDANPSVIQGRISANGEVLLQNQNGIVFGPNARVETGRFVATALQVAEEAYKKGLRGITDGSAAFEGIEESRNAFVSLERGAEVRTAAGGDVLIFAPRVVNEGRIETPDGQTILGAGRTVYMTASADPAQRGLIVGIRPYGGDAALDTVIQAEAKTYKTLGGETVPDTTPSTTAGVEIKSNGVFAERGSINLVAMAIRQNGLLQATTAVKGRNGSIQLLAQADVNTAAEVTISGQPVFLPQTTALGTVVLAPGSVTQVLPSSASAETQFDSEAFYASRIRVEGERINVQGGAVVRAPAGRIDLLASNRPDKSLVFNPTSFDLVDHSTDTSRVVVEAGATLDVAGLKDVALPMARNQMSGRLFQIELADAPVQRDGVLYREEVFFDARKPPSVANVSGFFNTVARTAQERSTTGGSINLQADGGVAVDARATLDISGGSVRYDAGTLKTSLVRQGNQWITLDKANAATRYDELGNSKARSDAGNAQFSVQEVPAYTEGKNAGELTVAARRVYFAGELQAQAIQGEAQDGRGSAATPQGGSFTLGRDRLSDTSVPSLSVQTGPARRRPADLFTDPLAASVDTSMQPTVVLSTTALEASGVATLNAFVAGAFTVNEGTVLALPTKGQLQVQAASAEIQGGIVARGGRIAITAAGSVADNHDISLGAQARLDTSGTWVVDSATLPGGTDDENSTLGLKGGQVQLSAAGSLRAEQGAALDVSAGARRAGTSLTKGTAGSINLALNQGADLSRALPGTFDAWNAISSGFDFDKGGSFALSGLPTLTLGGAQPTVAESLFRERGFGSITLNSLGEVRLKAGLNLQAQLRNYAPLATPGTVDAQGRFASVQVLPLAAQRAPVNVALNATTGANRVAGVAASNLAVEPGARLATEAGGSLRLSARGALTMAGTLDAPGGQVTLALAGARGGAENAGVFEDTEGFDPAQALWVTHTARLNAAGTTELSADRLGRNVGQVLGGGTISLLADRGYVVAQAGAQFDLRGASASVLGNASNTPQTVSRSGGNLVLRTPEGFHFASQVQAQAADGLADGGSFSASVTLGGRERKTAGPAYPTQNREIQLTDARASVPALDARQGTDLTTVLGSGVGQLSREQLAQGGFSQVALTADDRITFTENTALQVTRGLTLDTPVLALRPGVEASVAAQAVSLGDSRKIGRLSFETLPVATGGTGVLEVNAGLIELQGDMALQGVQFTGLNATLARDGQVTRGDGEIRFIGVARAGAAQASGSLGFAGELQLTAGQSYTTTLSQYAVQGLTGNSLLGTYLPAQGSLSQAPLSAMGQLSLKADALELGGVLRQPFGSIDVQSQKVAVLAGAELSVSGAGLTVPVGTTVNARQWQYRASGLTGPSGNTLGVDATSDGAIRVLNSLPVAKGIRVESQALQVAQDTQWNVAGGGQMQAWEFVAGVGGSSDALNRTGTYAVLPGYRYDFAPYDAEVMNSVNGAALPKGGQVAIEQAGSALNVGRYTLLPARYALLPGAVVVNLAADQGKGPLAETLALDDGSAVVAGRFGAVGSQVGSATGSNLGTRVQVSPAATVAARANNTVTQVGTLLATTAARQDLASPVLPGDGGRLSLVSGEALLLNAQLLAGADAGNGRGAIEVAVRNGRTAIVDNPLLPPAGLGDDVSLISARSLNDSGAGSLLIGGVLGADQVVTPTNQTVQLLTQAEALKVQEVLLVGKEAVRVGTGARLDVQATSAAPAASNWTLRGDSAYVLATHATTAQVNQTAQSGQTLGQTGRLVLEEGSAVQAPTVRLGGLAGMEVSAAATVQANDMGLAVQRLAVGTPTQPQANTTVLAGSLLAAATQAKALTLSSLTGIDFYGSHQLIADQITLDSPLVRGAGNAGDVVQMQAREVVLRNTSPQAAQGTAPGVGQLQIKAQPVLTDVRTGGLTLGSSLPGQGSVVLGFQQANLHSSGDIVFAGNGQFTAQADATLSAARITASTGSEQGFQAPQGRLELRAEPDARSLGESVGQGARLNLSARTLEQAGRLELPGGQLSLQASGTAGETALRFAAGSRTSVAGVVKPVNDAWTLYGDGGRIRASATQGDVEVAGQLDVSAQGNAQAGQLHLNATGEGTQGGANAGALRLMASAELRGQGGSGARQGEVTLDAQRVQSQAAPEGRLDAWATGLKQGGFGQAVEVRVRQGDAQLGSTLQAERVTLTVDRGALSLTGPVDARAAAGGEVRLFARDNLTLAGQVDARSSRAGANGGSVQLGSREGQVVLTRTAQIDTRGDDAADGRIVLRAARQENSGGVNVQLAPELISTQALQGAEINVEAVRTYSGFTALARGNSSGATLGQNTVRADQQAFADASGNTLNQLGLANDPRASLRPSVEVRATGDFTVRDDWNLWEADRPGGQPGFLTVRAAGNLAINANVSDGFANAARPSGNALLQPTEIKDGAAWSLRFAAGADLASADPVATQAQGTGNLSLANDKWVRTTAGSIELAAARDIVLTGSNGAAQQGVVYVAGRPSQQNTELALTSSAWAAQFTAQGGGVTLSAGRDVVGTPATQLFGGWFYHTGTRETTAVAWWSGFDAFRQGVGSFGGGNLRVSAGRDVLNLGAVVPTSALAAGVLPALDAEAQPTPELRIENGGNLAIQAERNIQGGTYFLGRGQGVLQAGNAIAAGGVLRSSTMPAIGPLLGAMEGEWQVSARTGVDLGPVFNPTMLPSAGKPFSGQQRIGDQDGAVFFTYAPDTALNVSTQAGTLAWRPDRPLGENAMAAYWSGLAGNGPAAERIDWVGKFQDATAYAPPIVKLQALAGDVALALPSISSGLMLFPSPQGQLSIAAGGDLKLAPRAGITALMVGTQPVSSLPLPMAPLPSMATSLDEFDDNTFNLPTAADKVVFSNLHDTNTQPVRLHADGSVWFKQGSNRAVLISPKAAEVTAGGDILEAALVGQHASAQDTTRIQAAGSIVQTDTATRITLAGPGTLALVAGRQLDLGASQGVETVGNLYRPTLPFTGADIVLQAGQRARVNVEAFVSRYLTPAAPDGDPQAQGLAQARAYLQATGQDPDALDSAGQDNLARLSQRFTLLAQLAGQGQAGAVQQRRDDLVVQVRSALGLPALARSELAGAYEATLEQFKNLSPATQTAFAEGLLSQLFVQTYLSPGQPYASTWQAAATAAGVDATVFKGPVFERLQREVLFNELNLSGGWAAGLPSKATALRTQAYGVGFAAADLAGLGTSLSRAGDVDMVASGVQTRQGGSIQVLTPGGQVNVGLPGTSTGNPRGLKGAVVYGQGALSAFAEGDFQVNSQRAFVVGQGNVTVWSSRGNIDAGRGANTAITVPPLVATRQEDGSIKFTLPALTVGSGIGILQPAVGEAAGDIGLYAPNGEVRALDAQIRAPGRITLAADVVRGADNISGGSVVGAPPAVPSVPLSLPSAAPAGGDSAAAAAAAAASQGSNTQAKERNSLLMVELLGLGLPAGEAPDPCQDLGQRARLECERKQEAAKPAATK